ncbi:hypothetical protein [Geothrix rubra]|nr:hypothetical protein [Geothrix rubra]
MKFKVNEVFHSIQGEGRGPVRERGARSPEGRERWTQVTAER